MIMWVRHCGFFFQYFCFFGRGGIAKCINVCSFRMESIIEVLERCPPPWGCVFQSEIWGSHSGADDDSFLVGCDTILIDKYLPSLQRSLPSLLSRTASFSKIRVMSYHPSHHNVPEDLNNRCFKRFVRVLRVRCFKVTWHSVPQVHIWCVVNPGSVMMNLLSSEIKFIVHCLFSSSLMLSVLTYLTVNPLEHTACCETGWAIDAFAVNSSFLSVDGMTCLILFESWRIDLSNGISHIKIGQIVSILRL
jgi:hypothetical protein